MMKLLSTLLLFAAVWVTAMAWSEDLRDYEFREYSENEVIAKQGEFESSA